VRIHGLTSPFETSGISRLPFVGRAETIFFFHPLKT
jgi:hypothetical protein